MRKFDKKNIVAIIAVMIIMMGNPIQARAAEKFDPVFYAAAYPDVVAVLGTDANALYNHYITYGQKEGRIPYEGAVGGENVSGITNIVEPTKQITDLTAVRAAMPEEYYDIIPAYDLSDWTPEQMALFAQKQQEFDASGLVHIGWTEEQVQEKLLSLKEIYPSNMVVGVCETGAGKLKTALYGNPSDWQIGVDKNGEQVYPLGFVYCWSRSKNNPTGSLALKDVVRVGDRVRTKGANGRGHIYVVLSRDENGITVVESNINDDKKMHWGRRIRWTETESKNSSEIWHTMEHYLY